MHFGADGPARRWRRSANRLENELGRTREVREVHHFLRTFRMHEHGAFVFARGHHMLRTKKLVHAAVPCPKQNLCVDECFFGEATVLQLGIPQRTLGLRSCGGRIDLSHKTMQFRGVSPQMLIRQKEDLDLLTAREWRLAACERPLKHTRSVGAGAARATMIANKRLDRRRRIHIGDGNHPLIGLRTAQRGLNRIPRVHRVVVVGHVGHRTSRGEVRQDDCDIVLSENVRSLGHEMHAAKQDVFRAALWRLLGGQLRELETVANKVCVTNDVVLLVVMTEDEQLAPQLAPTCFDRVTQLRFSGVEIALRK